MFKIFSRYFSAADYPTIESWWIERECPVPIMELLPPTGIVMSENGEDLCAGFLFKTDARIAIINHVVSNPTCKNKEARSEAIDIMLNKLIEEAKCDGFLIITAASNVDRLNKRYEAMGFFKSDENETHYGRIL